MDLEQNVDASETKADLKNDGCFDPKVFKGENEGNIEELISEDIVPVKNEPEKQLSSSAQNEENLYATFILEGDEFAVDVNSVREAILLKQEIVRVPNTINIVEGILNLRGEIIPVVNLKKRFEMESVEYDSECRVAIVRYRKFNFGLLFDDISEVIRVHKKEVKEIESAKKGINSSIEGVINLEDDKRIIQVFNTDLLLEEYDLPLIKEITCAEDSIHNISRLRVLDTMQCITIIIDGQEYGINVDNIREIIKPVEVKRKVKIEEYVKGVFFQRKELLSLIDMRLYMKLLEKEVDQESRFLIINDENPYGILVDAIKEVITFEKDDILKIPLLSENCLKNCFGGIVNYSNGSMERHIILIDVEFLFDEYGKMRIQENLSLHKNEQTNEVKGKKVSKKQEKNSSGEVAESRVYISFLLEEVLAVDILMLQEIIPYTTNILNLPNQFDSFEGILNLRGNIIPVINLRKFFEMDPYPDINNSKIIILNHLDNCSGFMVDDVQEIITTDSKSCEGVNKILTMGRERQFKGLISEVLNVSLRDSKNRTIMVLNIDAFLKGIDLKKSMTNVLPEMEELEGVKSDKKAKNKSSFFQKLKIKNKKE
ncbi:MAG: hypothetical protein GY714_29540 [Desulfobacterales bacterium]|nr:hypothetical protein [Desulfobacterales bacterium]MCP4163217.1 hypothetical protein [Deltaproteobacteria bacterium]